MEKPAFSMGWQRDLPDFRDYEAKKVLDPKWLLNRENMIAVPAEFA